MVEGNRTEGERQFERYLDSMRYSHEFEKPYANRVKKPDYTITTQGTVFLADVKDFDQYLPRSKFMQMDVHFRIREKIQAGYKKFKEYKDFPCCVVLQNNGNVHVFSEDAHIVLGAMYGTIALQVPIYLGDGLSPANPPEPRWAFTQDAQMTVTKNTTISALVSLRRIKVGRRKLRRIWKEIPNISVEESIEVASQRFPNFDPEEEQLGVIVWENAFARLPLSREVFNGPLDERWGLESGHIQNIFVGTLLSEIY
jgi:hypothetical protein